MVSEETRKKMGDAHGGKLVTDDTRKKLSEANKGQKRSQETRTKMSEAQKLRYENPDERRKISEGNADKKTYRGSPQEDERGAQRKTEIRRCTQKNE
jgi:hypothetical protein